ncbi:MAG: fibronectin type III domain-containing protein, partial [Anaerolineales bacterium]
LDGSTWESLGTTAADVTSYADKNLQADTSYTYRVLAYNASGSSGYSNTASATTQQASFLHVGDLDGRSSPAHRGRWDATVSITVHDVNEQAVAGATVSGSWSGGASGSDTCVTDSNGLCNITKANIKSNVSNVLFTVTDITKDATVYQSTDNHDTDGDSDGTSITINQP